MSIDPVCGIDVDEKTARKQGLTAEHEGTTYFFCSADCMQTFQRFPNTYSGLRATESGDEAADDQLSA